MRTALITGVSRGLGLAIAKAFVQSGWNTIGVARSSCTIPDVQTAKLDVRDEQAVTELIHSLERLDVVVNNAGIASQRPLLETQTAELREILETNVVAAFVVMRESARRMVGQGGGHIINIASDASYMGFGNMAPYVGSKHAVLGIGRSVSLELRKQRVRVCTYCPGPINTAILGEISGNSDALKAEDIARTIVYIAESPPEVEVQEMLVRPMKM